MRITILSVGTRGDVQPYVALGLGLRTAGHQVRLATHPQFKSFIQSHQLEFFPLHGNPQEILQGELAQRLLTGGRDTVRLLGMFVQLGRELMDQLHQDIWRACQGTEAVVYTPLAVAGHFAAKKLGVPRLGAPLQPISRTWTQPSIFMPRWLRFGIPFNYLSHLFVEQMLWQPSRNQVNRWLMEDLDTEPLSFKGPFSEIYHSKTPLLFGFSEKVYAKPRDWPPNHYITGYWPLVESPDWQPPDGLIDFLESGPPPVYAGFGSMPSSRPEESAEIVLEALRLGGQRGLLLRGWGGLSASDLPEDVHMIESAPHEWLFPRMAAVIHHGGAGTTAAGLRAGVPSIIVPHFSDQPFWAERVRALGVGPRPIPRRRLSPRRLAAAMRRTGKDESMRSRAAKLGEKLREENGVGRAVEIIQAHLEAAKA